jgi:hypothetical protein
MPVVYSRPPPVPPPVVLVAVAVELTVFVTVELVETVLEALELESPIGTDDSPESQPAADEIRANAARRVKLESRMSREPRNVFASVLAKARPSVCVSGPHDERNTAWS